MSSDYKAYTEKMDKTIDALMSQYASVRAGRCQRRRYRPYKSRLLRGSDAHLADRVCFNSGSQNACYPAMG